MQTAEDTQELEIHIKPCRETADVIFLLNSELDLKVSTVMVYRGKL